VIKVVMNGWPATDASTFLSFRTCSTCFNLMTVTQTAQFVCSFRDIDMLHIPSTFFRTFNANTLLHSSGLGFAGRTSQTRAKVPANSLINYDVPVTGLVQLALKGSNIPVPSVFISSKSSTRSCCAENPSCLFCGSCAICSGGTSSRPAATS